MKPRDPRQLELFADGARTIAAVQRRRSPTLTEADLQAKLEAARMRLRELVVFGMKARLPAATLHRLRDAEQWRPREVLFVTRLDKLTRGVSS
jgi:hypothetical protein